MNNNRHPSEGVGPQDRGPQTSTTKFLSEQLEAAKTANIARDVAREQMDMDDEPPMYVARFDALDFAFRRAEMGCPTTPTPKQLLAEAAQYEAYMTGES